MMHREQLELLKSIQAVDFTAIDLHLYLNTHPDDQCALNDFSNTVQESARLKQIYTSNYGPLTPMDAINQPCWRWIEEPWPWEIEY